MNKSKKPFTGLHVLGEITTDEVEKLKSLNQTKKYIRNVIKKYNLHELGSFYYKFLEGGGFTGLVSLVESHISIHTWPELGYLTLDVYLCNYSKNNSSATKKIFGEIAMFFKPMKIIKRAIKR
uniref:Adenosylmethionine decarboxylase n=1 Tax=candidate division CPR3 bacterium TaxID=2268181 RepID=A0A7V3J9X6_UNCC3